MDGKRKQIFCNWKNCKRSVFFLEKNVVRKRGVDGHEIFMSAEHAKIQLTNRTSIRRNWLCIKVFLSFETYLENRESIRCFMSDFFTLPTFLLFFSLYN